MEECNKRYGDIFALQLGQFAPQVFISNPQAIQQIFTTDPKQLDSGEAAGGYIFELIEKIIHSQYLLKF